MKHTLKKMIAIFILEICLRIGEARNPGPSSEQAEITIGCINPTGIMNKADVLSSLPGQGPKIWGVSETHLSKQGIAKFQSELKFRCSQFKFLPGAPAPLRSTSMSSLGGKQVGTGFLSNCPCRNLTHNWDDSVWKEARFSLSTFYIQGHWIHAAVVYGYAFRAASVEVREMTNSLIKQATHRLVHCMRGKRILMGDFNLLEGQLDEIEKLKQFGWKEIQLLDLERTRRPISFTCKQTSTKDFVWISPELVPYFLKADTCSLFSDHEVLFATFKPFGPISKVHLWRKPKPIDWNADSPDIPVGHFKMENDNPEEAIKTIAAEFEDRVHQAFKASNMPGLIASQRGRSRTTHTREVLEHHSPIKPSRSGEKQVEFLGHSLMHKQWFSQMRRFQSIRRTCCNNESNLHKLVHMQREWRAIIKASGFPQGFPTWWSKLEEKIGDSPSSLPDNVPSRQDLVNISLTFEREFSKLETLLCQTLIAKAKQNRIDNPHRIFADIKKPPVQPVVMLDESIRAKVDTVIDDELIKLDKPVQFDPQKPIFGPHGIQQIVQVDPTTLKVPFANSFEKGDIVGQDKFEASIQTLFEKFAAEWNKRWDKHKNFPVDHWTPLIDCFNAMVPQVPEVSFPPITVELWKQTLRKKKSRSATGPDAWSRQDLLKMPHDITAALISMLEQIEMGSPWPRSTVTGIVFSLEKVQGASRVNQYRPITVFSLIYRTWSSIRAKQSLQHLVSHAPSFCFGNLPKRSAVQVWLGIQSQIETCHFDNQPLSGAMIDIEKCFNHLPRLPLLSVCCRLGLPSGTIRAWTRALTQMKRRFAIRGSVSPPHRSSTGCAEGCALSVVGMLAINILTDAWVHSKVPQAKLWSYVDNLEITANSVDTSVQALAQLETVLTALDLTIDQDKTFMWANKATDRKQLRVLNHQTKLWARDLGGHVQYGRQCTNSVITRRISAFKERWRDIARSHAPYHQKLTAIKMVAWPNAMHGVTSVHLSDEWYEELRTGAVRGLGSHASGTSPVIHLSLVEHPAADPGFFALAKTVIDTRTFLNREACERILSDLCQSNMNVRPEPGPAHVLHHRLLQIGWHWNPAKGFVDCKGWSIDIWNCPIQELMLRLVESWQNRIQHLMSSRKTFKGLWKCNPGLTKRGWPKNRIDQGILRTALNGTFFTADHLKYLPGELSQQCPFCKEPDSQRHRHWICPNLEEARTNCDKQIRQQILSMEPAVYNHGWIPQPESLGRFRQHLRGLPDSTGIFQRPPSLPDHLHLFTDGSCKDPQDQFTRLATWGVMMGTQDMQCDFFPLAQGLLPGVIQTAARSELTAAISALKFAARFPRPTTLWIDNDSVVQAIEKFIHQKCEPPCANIANHDLLQELHLWINFVRPFSLEIIKVCSHQDLENTSDPIEAWAIRGNNAVDELATHVYFGYPEILETRHKLRGEISYLENLKGNLHKTIVNVGNLAMDLLKKQREGTHVIDTDNPETNEPRSMQEWKWPQQMDAILPPFRLDPWSVCTKWNETLHTPNESIKLWSWCQLVVDFGLETKMISPWYCRSSKRWKIASSCPRSPISKRCRWFKTYVGKMFEQSKLSLPMQNQRPDSYAIHFWCHCLPVTVPEARCRMVDDWLLWRRSTYLKSSDLQTIWDVP